MYEGAVEHHRTNNNGVDHVSLPTFSMELKLLPEPFQLTLSARL